MKTSIKQWRKARGLTLEQLSELVEVKLEAKLGPRKRGKKSALGASVATLSRIEAGKYDFSASQLEAIAAALGCQPADLLQPYVGVKDNAMEARAVRLVRALNAQQQEGLLKMYGEHLDVEDERA